MLEYDLVDNNQQSDQWLQVMTPPSEPTGHRPAPEPQPVLVLFTQRAAVVGHRSQLFAASGYTSASLELLHFAHDALPEGSEDHQPGDLAAL